MMTTYSAFTVKTCIQNPPNAGHTIHVRVSTAMTMRPSTPVLNVSIHFLRHSQIFSYSYLSLIVSILQNNTTKRLIPSF
jgi:hypothetical protein